ncbi:hypothetical protein AAF712_001294 [Marasmius tenuissimus]|uniref:TEA domain-containing protein n=1 Tax=Marasmius tenuissimus TaxID=585030 RepID=A0ABR3ADI5_9AGAR
MSPPKSTLTPQRKHRKLLKDGSGSEVWPEHIEAIFVDGLRAYWESPWATYSGGRSRWRNQYLVEFLHGKGIVRSKKQVASHLQVLRNMWKGEPEYHLVAGADEQLNQSSPSHPESDSSSSTPNSLISLSLPSSPPTSVNNSPSQELNHLLPPTFPRRATALTLSAQHMTPFHVKIDGLLPPQSSSSSPPPPAVIKLRLSIPPNASSSLPALQGFAASVFFSGAGPSIGGRCITKVYVDGAKQSQVNEALVPSPVKREDAELEMYLPDSTLSSCRWMDHTKRAGITQEISLDGQPVLYLVYDVDRNTDFPGVQIVKYQRYSAAAAAPPKRSRSTSITRQVQHPYYQQQAPPPPSSNYTWGTTPSSSNSAPLFQLSSSPTTDSYNNFYTTESSPPFMALESPPMNAHQLQQFSSSPPPPQFMGSSAYSQYQQMGSSYQQQHQHQQHQPVYNYS